METKNWHDVMALLTAVILADERVYKEEVDSFVHIVTSLNKKLSPGIFLTEGMVFDWFIANRSKIAALLVGRDKDRNINELIARLGNVPSKRLMVEAMMNIARSDSQYHSTEDQIICRAAKAWKIDIPRAKRA